MNLIKNPYNSIKMNDILSKVLLMLGLKTIVMKSFKKKKINNDSPPVMAAILFFIRCPKSTGNQ